MVMKVRGLLFTLFLWAYTAALAIEPQVVYLTWTDDPATTMTVQWHTDEGAAQSQLEYRGSKESDWKPATGTFKTVEGTKVDVHLIHLEGLQSDSLYLFKLQGSKREYKFRTMPLKLTRSIKIAIGGDAYYIHATEIYQRMCKMVAFQDPDFIVVGGDLAYTKGSKQIIKGRKWEMARWQGFLRGLQRSNMSRDGRLVPMLPIIGNHDVAKSQHKTDHPEMFFDVFAFPESKKAYRTVGFGDYLSLVLLDSNHHTPIDGEQTEWLEKALARGQNAIFQLVAYHIAAYPSHYSLTLPIPEKLRKYWVPLFEKYQVPFAFEHHNHTYKRTHPIKEGKVDPSGVTYLGDGSWGVAPRVVRSPKTLWYLKESASDNVCYIVTLTEEKCLIEAKNMQGEVIDKVEYLHRALQPK
jgi:hypothetical protein